MPRCRPLLLLLPPLLLLLLPLGCARGEVQKGDGADSDEAVEVADVAEVDSGETASGQSSTTAKAKGKKRSKKKKKKKKDQGKGKAEKGGEEKKQDGTKFTLTRAADLVNALGQALMSNDMFESAQAALREAAAKRPWVPDLWAERWWKGRKPGRAVPLTSAERAAAVAPVFDAIARNVTAQHGMPPSDLADTQRNLIAVVKLVDTGSPVQGVTSVGRAERIQYVKEALADINRWHDNVTQEGAGDTDPRLIGRVPELDAAAAAFRAAVFGGDADALAAAAAAARAAAARLPAATKPQADLYLETMEGAAREGVGEDGEAWLVDQALRVRMYLDTAPPRTAELATAEATAGIARLNVLSTFLTEKAAGVVRELSEEVYTEAQRKAAARSGGEL